MIKKVSEQDKISWAKLCCQLWCENTVDEIITNELTDNQHCYLYYFNGEPIAFINLSIRTDYVEGTSGSPVGYIEGIFVKEEFRNQGIAKYLVDFAKKWALKNACVELASDCELGNDNSRKFHNKVGFNEAGTIVCFIMKLKKE